MSLVCLGPARWRLSLVCLGPRWLRKWWGRRGGGKEGRGRGAWTSAHLPLCRAVTETGGKIRREFSPLSKMHFEHVASIAPDAVRLLHQPRSLAALETECSAFCITADHFPLFVDGKLAAFLEPTGTLKSSWSQEQIVEKHPKTSVTASHHITMRRRVWTCVRKCDTFWRRFESKKKQLRYVTDLHVFIDRVSSAHLPFQSRLHPATMSHPPV